MSKKKNKLKKYAKMNFLDQRKDDLNEIADEDIIYEESQTGPQEEPTLKEIILTLSNYEKKHNLKK